VGWLTGFNSALHMSAECRGCSSPLQAETSSAHPLFPPCARQVENQAHEQGNFAVWEKEGQEQMQKDMAQRMKGLQQDQNK
jgi:hypothetical protein